VGVGVTVGEGVGDAVGDAVRTTVDVADGVGAVAAGAHAPVTISATRSILTELP
jgi:hypothetical protein